jgi:thymidine kinase
LLDVFQASKAYSRLTKAHQLLHKVEKQLTLAKSKRMLFEARMRLEQAKEALKSHTGQDTKAAQTELENAKTNVST